MSLYIAVYHMSVFTSECVDFVSERIGYLLLFESSLRYLLWSEVSLTLGLWLDKWNVSVGIDACLVLFSISECHRAALILLLCLRVASNNFYLSLLISNFNICSVHYWHARFALVVFCKLALQMWTCLWHLSCYILMEIVVRSVAAVQREDYLSYWNLNWFLG